MVTHRHDEGPWECTPYCACTFATWQERDAHLDAMTEQRQARAREAKEKKVTAKKKVIGPAYGSNAPRDISDLDVLLDEYGTYRGPFGDYTWKGGGLVWSARIGHRDDDNGEETVELLGVWDADSQSYPRGSGDRRWEANKHPVTGLWLVRTPAGDSIHDTAEEALDTMNAVYAGLPPERTSTVTITGLTPRYGVSNEVVVRELARFIRTSHYFKDAGFTSRKIKITEN